jgi:hypothetical protein
MAREDLEYLLKEILGCFYRPSDNEICFSFKEDYSLLDGIDEKAQLQLEKFIKENILYLGDLKIK